MTEVKLELADPVRAYADLMAAVDATGNGVVASRLGELARQMKDQLPAKPTIEEPTEPWTVIRAKVDGEGKPCELVLMDGWWSDSQGNGWGDYRRFTDVEVLRVGVDGPPSLSAKADPYNDQEWSNAACPEHGTHCSGPKCCCADKHPADPVEEQILLYSQHLYATAATMTEEMVELNLRTFAARVLEAGKAA